MKNKYAVRLSNISKTYLIHHEKPTLMENILNGWHSDKFTALRNINLKIDCGEVVGIIGPNGSGKTTLLKIIAGITTPTRGVVETAGRLVSLIDLEAGFHPDLSGEENLHLSALLLGVSKKEVDRMKEKVIEFAGLGDFISAPLYTYSSGMKLRLGFSVAIHTDPDILILDENLSVGDEAFREKIDKKLSELSKNKKTFILVSHDLELIRYRCKRVFWINMGKLIMDGPVKKIINSYKKSLSKEAKSQ